MHAQEDAEHAGRGAQGHEDDAEASRGRVQHDQGAGWRGTDGYRGDRECGWEGRERCDRRLEARDAGEIGQVYRNHGQAARRDERDEARDEGRTECDGAHEARVSSIIRARVWSSGNGWAYFSLMRPRRVMKNDSGWPVVPYSISMALVSHTLG